MESARDILIRAAGMRLLYTPLDNGVHLNNSIRVGLARVQAEHGEESVAADVCISMKPAAMKARRVKEGECNG